MGGNAGEEREEMRLTERRRATDPNIGMQILVPGSLGNWTPLVPRIVDVKLCTRKINGTTSCTMWKFQCLYCVIENTRTNQEKCFATPLNFLKVVQFLRIHYLCAKVLSH